MSDVETALTASGEQLPTESATPEPASLQQRAADNRHGTRIKVSVHRLDGGLEGGESDARVLTSEGFPIFTPPDSDRARWIPARDIKYVVLGSVDDSNLEADPGDKSSARKAILRFRDGEWIAAYMDPGQASDGAGVAIQIRLTERQRIIPAVAASAALLEMQFVDAWTSTPDAARPLRRRSDIMEAAARQGRDLNRLADDFRDRLALIRDVGLTTGDTLAFSRAVRTHLDRFLAEDGIELSAPEKTTLADIILRAAVLGRMNVLVSGGTGSGKTTSLNVIARFIPHNQRVITIEDAAELQIDHPHVISLEHRPPNVEGKGELTIRQLLRNSLRMRPDRILVGEVRGSEALDMLQAMNTGHDGSMSTIHSNSARDALSRLETMVMMASIDIPFEAVRAQIASAVNLIVHQARMPDGRRKVAQIAEVVGYDQNGAILRDIFLLGMGGDLRLEYNATGYVPSALDKAAFYGVQVDQDLFDPVKARFIPAGSDSMMPVVKDPLISGQRGGEEKVVRQVVVVPFSSDRPGQQQTVQTQASSSAPAQSMASTPEMQEEMRKLIDAARSAVADLQAAAPPSGSPAAEPVPVYQPPPMAPAPQQPPAPLLGEVPAMQRVAPIAAGPVPAVPVHQISAGDSVAASQALQAATAMARATTELGRMAAAAQSGFIANAGMLPTVQSEGGHGGLGVSRRLNAVIESIVSNKNLNLRLAPAITQVFEGAELKASDYAKPNHLSKESAARELRQAAEAGLLEMVKYAQGEAGFRSGASLLREVAAGLGQRIDASSPLTADTIIGSLSTGQTEGTVSIMFTDVEGSTNLLSTRGFTESHEIMKAYETIVGEMITEHAGRRIKGLGDGVMVSFGSTRHAVECALAIQRAITDYSKANPHRRLRIRIGINTGEVVEEAGDIFGAAVNMAARVAGKAKGGQVLVSEVVRQLVGPVTEIDFTYRGHYKLKGFPDRWRLHEATPGEMPAAIAPIVTTPGDSFVGRAQEKLDIRLVLDRAATGTGGMILLARAPGIGASRLVAEVSTEAARKGWIVLSGRCAEQEESP